jgi:hypothetical protein
MYATDPTVRDQFIAGLRALADYLAAHPAIPVPGYSNTIHLHADSTENGGSLQVDRVARLLDAKVTDETPGGGHYHASRRFGPVNYEVVSIPEICMARHDAAMSYRACVVPDEVKH